MSGSTRIICSIAFWYYRRMLLIVALMAFGGGWFFYDGKVAWPKKNVAAIAKRAFESASEGIKWSDYILVDNDFIDAGFSEPSDELALIMLAHSEGGKARPWSEYIISSSGRNALERINNKELLQQAYDAGLEGALTWKEYARENDIPDSKEGANGDSKHGQYGWESFQSAFYGASKKRQWAFYGTASGQKGWDVKNPVYHSSSELVGQLGIAYVLWAMAVVAFFWMLISRRRRLSADDESLTTERGVRVLFTSVFEVDVRKWDKKGLAYAKYHNEDGADRQAVIDDLKYKEADEILERLLSNFSGRLIEKLKVKGEGVNEEDQVEEKAVSATDIQRSEDS
ncbi:MAG: hypothetical protein GY899_03220 [Verrucomicrobiaceae bacterium]|nr:hypothetical protein [Verrucomicrobiaceae bacterium]